jgi:hypothetical protein
VAWRDWTPRAGVFCSTVMVASWSFSVGNSITDARVDFGLRVVMMASLFIPLRPDVEMSSWHVGLATGLMWSYVVRPGR